MAAAARRLHLRLHLIPFSSHQSPAPPVTVKKSPKAYSYRTLRDAFLSEPDPSAAVAALVAAFPSTPRIFAIRPLFSLVVSRLRRARRPDLAINLLNAAVSHPSAPTDSPGFLARFLSLFSSAGLPDAALQAFCNSRAEARTDLSFSALLAAFLHNGRPSDVIRLFDDESKQELASCRGISSHNVYLSALCAVGSVDRAFQVLDVMRVENNGRPKADIVSYNSVLSACLKRGDDLGFDTVLRLLDQSVLQPNVVTFNCRISKLCRNKEASTAEEMLSKMESMKVMPNLGTFNELIKGFRDEKDATGAIRVFRTMKAMKRNGNDDAAPNADTYLMLLQCLVEKGQLEEAMSVLSESLARKVVPPFGPVKSLVEGLVKASEAEKAKMVVANMTAAVQGDAVSAWGKLAAEISFDDVGRGEGSDALAVGEAACIRKDPVIDAA